ncbi:MAG: porin family protein [Rhizobiaceae bacterium]|nr:porin family protein [Rhizobiaceae bacterium]
MKKIAITAATLGLATTMSANAADISTPPVYHAPEVTHHEVKSATGWYLRGDVGFAHHKLRRADYTVGGSTNNFVTAKLKSSFSVGAGVGYQVTDRFRSDLTLDYIGKSDFTGSTVAGCGVGAGPTVADCTSTDLTSWTAWSLMANAYVDVFTYGRVTGYVGAGLGATYINWHELSNTACLTATPTTCDPTVTHGGAKGWRATMALMAGASVKINCALDADLGYRYRYMAGGRFFQIASGAGPGVTRSLHSHEARAGLRYSFGGCDTHIPPYEPPTLPPVYK